MVIFYQKLKKYNEIQLAKNKMDLNNRKIKNYPPSPDALANTQHSHALANTQHSHALTNTQHSHDLANTQHSHDLANTQHSHALANTLHLHANVKVSK